MIMFEDEQILKESIMRLTFGKHRGKSLEEVAENHPSYILWLREENVINIPDDIFFTACTNDANSSPPEEYYWQPG